MNCHEEHKYVILTVLHRNSMEYSCFKNNCDLQSGSNCSNFYYKQLTITVVTAVDWQTDNITNMSNGDHKTLHRTVQVNQNSQHFWNVNECWYNRLYMLSGNLSLGIRTTQTGSKNVFFSEFFVLYLNTVLSLRASLKSSSCLSRRSIHCINVSQKFPLLAISTNQDLILIKISSVMPQ